MELKNNQRNNKWMNKQIGIQNYSSSLTFSFKNVLYALSFKSMHTEVILVLWCHLIYELDLTICLTFRTVKMNFKILLSIWLKNKPSESTSHVLYTKLLCFSCAYSGLERTERKGYLDSLCFPQMSHHSRFLLQHVPLPS